MAIKIRRGNKADLVETNLSVGEPVIALDTKEVGIMGASGEMVWLATKDLINVSNGIAGLDENGKVAAAQLPAMDYVPTSRKVADLALSSDITLAQLTAAGLASGDSSGNAANALKLGGIPASGFPQISSGTWTPTLRGDDVAGSPTYVTQHGVYIRISNLVHVFFNLELSAKGGMQGLVRVSGLPYAIAYATAASDISAPHGADGTVPFGCYASGTEIAVNSTADQLGDNYAIWAGHAVYIAV